MKKTKILGVVGSPRKKGNTYKYIEQALQGAESVFNIETEIYDMATRKFHHCIGCNKCLEKGDCVFKDDFQEFLETYFSVDGIIWGAPVYHLSVPASMKALLDRLGQMLLMHYLMKGIEVPRLSKVCGVLANGGHRNGGQDLVVSFLSNSCLAMNGVVVSGDNLAGNYIGASGWSGMGPDPLGKEGAREDVEGINSARILGQRVAEMANIVKVGISNLKQNLPAEYFYKWEPEQQQKDNS